MKSFFNAWPITKPYSKFVLHSRSSSISISNSLWSSMPLLNFDLFYYYLTVINHFNGYQWHILDSKQRTHVIIIFYPLCAPSIDWIFHFSIGFLFLFFTIQHEHCWSLFTTDCQAKHWNVNVSELAGAIWTMYELNSIKLIYGKERFILEGRQQHAHRECIYNISDILYSMLSVQCWILYLFIIEGHSIPFPFIQFGE